ncbi:hypothetical protein NIIDMKKI_30210 [Mycobacterium kansasii]|uniref:Uncharacterized protein n=1 Tax=Mycobacterium kansasii TaxID=1768 RepID=A0A1V3WDE7_MYCKA|nr:hypothetical protein I547_7329 [Mycobacterium kansasii 824]OOK64798.1 hypothetical protein BZL29_8104 [Mycobacterium kansasii]BCI87815.1 hypothetical protein NIIDMKKI_30210 [Mycobacterium kansasii]
MGVVYGCDRDGAEQIFNRGVAASGGRFKQGQVSRQSNMWGYPAACEVGDQQGGSRVVA